MPFDIPKTQTPIPDAGNHLAIAIQVIDLGTQESPTPGFNAARKIRIVWELPHEKHKFSDEKGEEPFTVAKEYTLSMNEKSNFRKDLESWRGKKFSESECSVFDETKIIGKPCFVSVIHVDKPTKTYANVNAVTAIPKGTTVPPQHNASIVYNTADGRNTTYLSLSEFWQKKIALSPEFQANTAPDKALDDEVNAQLDEAYKNDEPLPF